VEYSDITLYLFFLVDRVWVGRREGGREALDGVEGGVLHGSAIAYP